MAFKAADDSTKSYKLQRIKADFLDCTTKHELMNIQACEEWAVL